MTMRRTCFVPFALLLAVLAGVSPARAQGTSAAPAVIVAGGEHEIKVAPDQAWTTVSVETRDSRGTEARRLGAAAMTSVMATLKNTGLPADAIQTIGFSLQPEYEYANGRQRMKGFILSNQVQVRMDDVSRVAEVLDAVGGLSLPSSSTLTVAGLRFDLKNRAGLERDALQGAVEAAMARAKSMAAGAGVTLGRTLRIEEGGTAGPPMKFGPEVMMAGGDQRMATPVSPSDVVIRGQVTVTVEIK
jgi:uncharacterized protein YggE